MLSVIILDSGEQNVVNLTYENLFRELKNMPDSELLVAQDWFDAITKVKNQYVCLVESDCLVSSGYFDSMMGLFKKNPFFRKLAVLSSSTAINNWTNRIYGYELGNNYTDGIIPIKEKKSKSPYPIEIAYIPGAILRMSMLRPTINSVKPARGWHQDLVFLSMQLSLAFWAQGDGNRVHINPNATYVTTEDYVNNIGHYGDLALGAKELINKFKKESI